MVSRVRAGRPSSVVVSRWIVLGRPWTRAPASGITSIRIGCAATTRFSTRPCVWPAGSRTAAAIAIRAAPASCSRPMSVPGTFSSNAAVPLASVRSRSVWSARGARSAVSSATVTAPPVTGLPKT